jgi:Fe-Mn family superoxide dismutase
VNFREPQYRELPGVVSGAALAEHVKLYQGYVERSKLGWDQGDGHDLAGAVLHDLYFSGLSPRSASPVPSALAAESGPAFGWGTLGAFWRDMRAAALEAKGWALLVRRPDDVARVVRLDRHNAAVPGYSVVVAVDCYEHAYWMDYGTRKADYLDSLWNAIDWAEVARRWREAG